MATLYASSNTARKFLLFFLVFAMVVLLWESISAIPGSLGGTQEDTRFFMRSNRIFGELPEFRIDSIPLNTAVRPQYIFQSTFSEAFPDVSYVYQILQPRENFQFLSTFEDSAATLGFDSEPSVDGNNYSWESEDGSKSLRYNSVSQVWSLNTDLPANADARSAVLTLATAANYESRLKTLLSRTRFNSKGFEKAVYSVKFLDLNSAGDMVATQDPLVAEFGFGTAYRVLPLADLKPTDERPELKRGQVLPTAFEGTVYTEDPRRGSFSTLFSYNLGNMEKDLYELDFVNFEYTQVGAYQIITPFEGFSRIQNGQGALVSLTQPTLDYFDDIENASVTKFSIDARRTEVAFYEPQEWIGYTFPIYVYYGTAELSNGGLANAIFFIDAVKRAN